MQSQHRQREADAEQSKNAVANDANDDADEDEERERLRVECAELRIDLARLRDATVAAAADYQVLLPLNGSGMSVNMSPLSTGRPNSHPSIHVSPERFSVSVSPRPISQ
jgi:hypothetical protein